MVVKLELITELVSSDWSTTPDRVMVYLKMILSLHLLFRVPPIGPLVISLCLCPCIHCSTVFWTPFFLLSLQILYWEKKCLNTFQWVTDQVWFDNFPDFYGLFISKFMHIEFDVLSLKELWTLNLQNVTDRSTFCDVSHHNDI